MARKGTTAQRNQRIKEIYTMLLDGYTYSEIIDNAKQRWDLSKASASKMISQATDIIKRNNAKEMDTLRNEANSRYTNWLKQFVKKGDIYLASKMQQRMDKINGLEEKRIKIDNDVNLDKMLEIAERLNND